MTSGFQEENKKRNEKISRDKNENTTCRNLWDTIQAVLGRKLMMLNAHIKKGERSEINNLALHLKELLLLSHFSRVRLCVTP